MKRITRLSLALIIFSLFSILYLATMVHAQTFMPPPVTDSATPNAPGMGAPAPFDDGLMGAPAMGAPGTMGHNPAPGSGTYAPGTQGDTR